MRIDFESLTDKDDPYSIITYERKGYKLLRNFCPICTEYISCFSSWYIPPMSKNPVNLVKCIGVHGEFWGCPNYPKCRYSNSLKEKRQYIRL